MLEKHGVCRFQHPGSNAAKTGAESSHVQLWSEAVTETCHRYAMTDAEPPWFWRPHLWNDGFTMYGNGRHYRHPASCVPQKRFWYASAGVRSISKCGGANHWNMSVCQPCSLNQAIRLCTARWLENYHLLNETAFNRWKMAFDDRQCQSRCVIYSQAIEALKIRKLFRWAYGRVSENERILYFEKINQRLIQDDIPSLHLPAATCLPGIGYSDSRKLWPVFLGHAAKLEKINLEKANITDSLIFAPAFQRSAKNLSSLMNSPENQKLAIETTMKKPTAFIALSLLMAGYYCDKNC